MELYTQKVKLISEIPGIGEETVNVFNRGGYVSLADLVSFTTRDERLSKAVEEYMRIRQDWPVMYWMRMKQRCLSVIRYVQQKQPCEKPPHAFFAPAHFICPLTLDWFSEPVCTPSGYSYERMAILDWIGKYGNEPLTRLPLSNDMLYPNTILLHALEYMQTEFLS